MQSAWSGGTHAWPGTEDRLHSQERATPNKVHIISYNAQPLPKEKQTMYVCDINICIYTNSPIHSKHPPKRTSRGDV